MAELIRFEQDPEAAPGAGVFHFDSGRSQYAYEPELAARVGKLKGALDAAPDQRVAGPGGGEMPLGPVRPAADDAIGAANELSAAGVQVRLQKGAIANVLPKGTLKAA